MSLSTIEQQIVAEYGTTVGFIKNHAVAVAMGELAVILLLALKLL